MKNKIAVAMTSIGLVMLGLVLYAQVPGQNAPHRVNIPAPPFTQCPPIGSSPSCGVLIEFTDNGTNIFVDPAVPPYDGSEDTLVGVQNDSSAAVNSITLSGVGTNGIPIFGFDGDGLCTYPGAPPGCPLGPTGYEGPNTSFSNISPDMTTGDVNFTGGLAPGASAYFSLEDRLQASLLTTISLTPPTASNPIGTSHTVTATILRGDGSPVVGRTVTFTIVSGPDAGSTGTGMTDVNGQVTFTYTNNGIVGTDTIRASFVNDQGSTQSATATKDWFAPTPPPGPTGFVIGDRNAVVGNHVTFWGAQWARRNSLSGGSAPSSFKGYANFTKPRPPACGGSWMSDPGNSSGPPASVPDFITVIVSSSVTKSGSKISGNIPGMAIVRTNPGYKPDPGHAGTGTVTEIVCP